MCFIELPVFERIREQYLDDVAFAKLQDLLLIAPEAGDLIRGAGGLRKLRFGDSRRGRGKRGGLRIVYYYLAVPSQIWFFTMYDKDEQPDLTMNQRAAMRDALKRELKMRRAN